MTANLVLTPCPHHITPFDEWIPEAIPDAVVLCPNEFVSQYEARSISAVGFADYLSEAPYCEAWRLSRTRRFDRVTVISELDIVRGARLRRWLGAPGQDVPSAEAFRNKVVMKEHVSRAGIAVPAFRRLDSTVDVLEFVHAHGYPVVVKPVDGAGSANVAVLRSQEELERYLEAVKSLHGMMIEEYVSDGMLHVDGLWEQGELAVCSVSEYVGSCIDYQRSSPLASAQLDPATPRYEEARRFASRVLRALPAPAFTGFHLEIFEAPDARRLVFCEIASRIGGARVNDSVQLSYGVNLAREWLRRQAGITERFPSPRQAFAASGWVVIPPTVGVLRAIPERWPEWVRGARWDAAVGSVLPAARNSVHAIVSYVVEGGSEAEVRARIAESLEYFTRTIVIERGLQDGTPRPPGE